VSSGHHIKKLKKVNSAKITKRKITSSTKIRMVFINIPIPIENATKPFLYSFLRGLKNVRIIRGRDRICKTERKYFAIRRSASKYQNLRKRIGKDRYKFI